MEPEILIRTEGRAGRLTLNRPQALNALTHAQCLATLDALAAWRDDPAIDLILLDGAGPRAFCSGGDIAQVWAEGRAGNFAMGRDFWRDEYRMNVTLARYPKPIVSFLHGFVMGGGVGYGCHNSHRIAGESLQLAMPECGIGLIPDVGGTWLLSRAPGAMGLYLGLTAARMGPGDAIAAGFADAFVPEAGWDALKTRLCATGDIATLPRHPAPAAPLADRQPLIDRLFAGPAIPDILAALAADDSDLAQGALKAMRRNSPLSMACTLALLRPAPATMIAAIRQEFRWVWRSMEQGDFLEGVRAQIIDKDRNPRWQHARPDDVTAAEVAAMLAPLGADDWEWTE
jgi:enoyl-CoA hydratase